MYRVKFIGERERPATDEVVIAGLVFRKGQELRLNGMQMVALRAHPQFGQFEFDISEIASVVAQATAPVTERPKKKRAGATPPAGSGISEEVTRHGDDD